MHLQIGGKLKALPTKEIRQQATKYCYWKILLPPSPSPLITLRFLESMVSTWQLSWHFHDVWFDYNYVVSNVDKIYAV